MTIRAFFTPCTCRSCARRSRGSWLSPLAADADLILPVEVGAPSPFDSLVPALALAEMLVAGVVDALGDQPRERIARYDRLWRDDGFEYTPS